MLDYRVWSTGVKRDDKATEEGDKKANESREC